MGKKKDKSSLGRAVIKDRFKPGHRKQGHSQLHTTELDDGYDWNKINLKSVTDENTLDEFLATAEMAGTEFTAEKLNYRVITPTATTGLPTEEEEVKLRATQETHRKLLTVPRRPAWDASTTAEELDQKERDSFLDWRRSLANLQEVDGIIMTPYEKNLDFWRQLWRVVERSDVIVQIADARNPLLFRCEDLEAYVKELDDKKINVLLINKADLLSEEQRQMWVKYFDGINLQVAFWSAVEEMERIKLEASAAATVDEQDSDNEESDDDNDDDDDDDSDDDNSNYEPGVEDCIVKHKYSEEVSAHSGETADSVVERVDNDDDSDDEWEDCDSDDEVSAEDDNAINDETVIAGTKFNRETENIAADTACTASAETESCSAHCGNVCIKETQDSLKLSNDSRILSGLELIELFKTIRNGDADQDDDDDQSHGVTTIGLVGYPNVGKSSTVNALLQSKKVPVSATPGRTKHFQTLYLDQSLMLCDCPGLVMPTFVSTKAEMITNGILPIDQMRDYVPPISLICKQVARDCLETVYGIMLPEPNEEDIDQNRCPTAHELLGCHASMRGFMTHKGIPDFQRSSRQILKDFVKGKLLYCHPPPEINEITFKSSSQTTSKKKKVPTATLR